jgi:hypothetical protein
MGEVISYLERVDPEAAARAKERYSCFDHASGDDGQAYGFAAVFGGGGSRANAKWSLSWSSCNGARQVRSLIPARVDRLPWSPFHTRLVMALGVAWVLDGLEITVASSVAGPWRSRTR